MPEERTGPPSGPGVTARPAGFGRPGPGGGRGGPRGSIAAMAYAEQRKALADWFEKLIEDQRQADIAYAQHQLGGAGENIQLLIREDSCDARQSRIAHHQSGRRNGKRNKQ